MPGQPGDTETTPLKAAAAPKSILNKQSSFKNKIRRRGKKEKKRKSVFAGDSYGSHGHAIKSKKDINVQSLTYVADESDVWRAHWAIEHFMLRGEFWNHGKFKTIQTYYWIIMTGIVQAIIAYGTNLSSKVFIDVSDNKSRS